jgi:hypothetical protein
VSSISAVQKIKIMKSLSFCRLKRYLNKKTPYIIMSWHRSLPTNCFTVSFLTFFLCSMILKGVWNLLNLFFSVHMRTIMVDTCTTIIRINFICVKLSCWWNKTIRKPSRIYPTKMKPKPVRKINNAESTRKRDS